MNTYQIPPTSSEFDFFSSLRSYFRFSLVVLFFFVLLVILVWNSQPWFVIEIIPQRATKPQSNKPIGSELAMQETAQLISKLDKLLIERSEKVEKLRKDYELYAKLAEIENEKARALIQQLESTVGRDKSKDRVFDLLINLFAGFFMFIFGILFGPSITRWLMRHRMTKNKIVKSKKS